MTSYFQTITERFRNDNLTHHYVSIFYIVAGIIFILALGLIYTKDIELWVDIGIGDEAKYLGDGVNILKNKPDPAWGPVYSLWYYVLSLFTKDSISLYYLNYKLMTILPCVALYLLLLKLKVTPAIGFYLSFTLLISINNIPTWPKISHFVLVLIFIGLIIVDIAKDKNERLFAVLIISLILVYVRPEFILTSIVFLGIILKRVIKNDFTAKRLIMAIIVTIILFAIIGIPYSPSRNLTAFGQAYHKYLDLNDRIDAGLVKDWKEILDEDFGYPKDITDIIVHNSSKFAKHVSINISRLPALYSNYIEILAPNRILPIGNFYKLLILLIFLLLLVITLSLNKLGNYKDYILSFFDEKKDLLLFALFLGLPPLASMILYYPRSHYIILLLPMIYLIIVLIIVPIKFKVYIKNIIAFCLLIAISFSLIPPLSSIIVRSDFKNLKAVEQIKKLNIGEQINLLENEGGLNVYLPENYKWIKIDSKKNSFKEFIKKRNINMIYSANSNSFNNAIQFRDDHTWTEFMTTPGIFGFTKTVFDYGGVLYLRKDVKTN